MQNNLLGKVAIDTSKRPRSRFNLPYDINTTADWGSVQPLVCRMMYPNTKNVVQAESLVRMAPLLNPTFGRVTTKQAHQFVDLEDIWAPWPSFYAKKTFNGINNYIPQTVPCVNQSFLSLFILTGAKFSIYQNISNFESENPASPSKARCPNATIAGQETLRNNLKYGVQTRFAWNAASIASSSNPQNPYFMPIYYEGQWIDWAQLLPDAVQADIVGSGDVSTHHQLRSVFLPSANRDDASLFDTDGQQYDVHTIYPYGGVINVPKDSPYNDETVNLEGADYVVPLYLPQSGSSTWNFGTYMAIRLSSFGKRIRKILLGCGYQIDFNTTRKVSILPLMAFFKGYYDLYGITQESNYEQTPLARFSNRIAQYDHNDLNACLSVNATESQIETSARFKAFMLSLGDCYYTEQQDYISAHTVSMNTTNDDGIGAYTSIVPPTGSNPLAVGPSGEAQVAATNPFSHLDIVMLQKLYSWVNAQSIAGRQIAAAIKAQGFESFLMDNHSNFIGASESIVPISDVVSTSNTFNAESGSGSILGQNGGRGVGYDAGKTFTYETDKFGYWIGMFAIVPKSGYSQGLDPTLSCLDKFDFYNPEFDGLGFEADDKSIVVGGTDFPRLQTNLTTGTFGLVPTYTRWKVTKNIQNGDFNLRGTRLTYDSFCLDKEIPSDDHDFLSNSTSDSTGVTLEFFRSFLATDLPQASPDLRYVGKFPWIGSFNRIFANFNQRDLYERLNQINVNGADFLMWISNAYDNFLVHLIVNMTSYAPMKPIEDSWLLEDGSKPDSRVPKA